MSHENAQIEFDNLAENYDEQLRRSLGAAGAGDIEKFATYKIEILKEITAGKNVRRILEFGCGTGRNMAYIQANFPQCEIAGCDISGKSLAVAASTAPITGGYTQIKNPGELATAYGGGTIDCIFVSNVFHHIPAKEHQAWGNAMFAILRKGGILVIFEHNPFNPLTRHIFTHSAIDRGAVMVQPSKCISLLEQAGFVKTRRRYTLFFLWRNLFFTAIEKALFWLPLGAQYYVCGEK